MNFEYLTNNQSGEETVKCSCGEIFDVSVFTEENLVLKDGVLKTVCPKCGNGIPENPDYLVYNKSIKFEDDCDCIGLSHKNDCHNWVLPY